MRRAVIDPGPYPRLVTAGFRRRSSYRLAMAAGVLTNSMFGIIRGSVFVAVLSAAGGSVAGYSAAGLSTYNWLAQALIGPINMWGSQEISDRVHTGDIATDLARPLDLQAAYLAQDLGESSANLLPRTVPTLVVGALTFGVAFPMTVAPWALGVVSVILAMVVSYLSRYLVQMASFWIVSSRGLEVLYAGFSALLGGLIFPTHLMPDTLRTLAYATPFPSILQAPVDVLSGYLTGADAVRAVVAQALWALDSWRPDGGRRIGGAGGWWWPVASPYVAILRSRLAAQRVYAASFAFDVAGSIFFGLIELAEIWIIFHNVRSLGGLTFEQVVLLFGLTHTGYAASQILVGHVDRMPVFLRSGTLDTLYLRPLSLLGQVVTSEVALRRVGWLTVGLAGLGYGLVVNDVPWTLPHAALLVMTLVTSTAIFSALFVSAGSLQFFLIDGPEATNAFTYGGRYASQQPTPILPGPLMLLFTFVVPVAFTGYLPALALLDLPAPASTPWLVPELAWAGPVAAGVSWAIAAGLWRIGVRHYQGGGG